MPDTRATISVSDVLLSPCLDSQSYSLTTAPQKINESRPGLLELSSSPPSGSGRLGDFLQAVKAVLRVSGKYL